LLLTLLAMLAFAANSLLCRLALLTTSIDPATFTTIRIVSGALVLGVIALARGDSLRLHGSWVAALALFGYAITFSFAYVDLSVATGALLLFGAVQATMIGYGRIRGERFTKRQLIGFLAAVAGLIALLLPGATTPSLTAALWMLVAGVAWGFYSLRGARATDPTATTASNFVRAMPFAIATSLLSIGTFDLDPLGVGYAIASGALASGIGYAIWYAALPGLTATTAATVQLSVPALAGLAGVLLLGETLTTRLALASLAILGGIAVVVLERRSR
jgi:drug/metabolite transporter (DMT)-like permease